MVEEITSRRLTEVVCRAVRIDVHAFENRQLDDLKPLMSPDDFEDLKAHFDFCDLAQQFGDMVWHDHLREFNEEASAALEAKDEKRIMRVLETAGRVLITLQDVHPEGSDEGLYNGAWITFITTADDPTARVGYQGLCGTVDEVKRLVRDVIEIGPRTLEETSGLSVW